MGPTASGKTELGLRWAKEQDGEIISVDSRQVYRFLRIGTAKPEGQWHGKNYRVRGIPYHLIDLWDPADPFTAADFVRLATKKIHQIRKRGKIPMLVGGTGLYFKALLEGLAPLPPRDESLRTQWRALADEKGRPYLHAQLAKVDPQAAHQIPANNIQRVLRALEVHHLTGKPISEWHKEHQAKLNPPNPPLQKGGAGGFEIIGLDVPREELHKRIDKRCTAMLKNGMIEETEQLIKEGYDLDCPALTGLGYPRVIAYLEGRLSREQLLEKLIRDTRHYAKRQMTWFRHQMKVTWKKF